MLFFLLTAMTRNETAQGLLPLVLEGRAQQGALLAMDALERGAVGAAAVEHAILAADLMLAQDRAEEAEDLYRQALGAAAGSSRGQVRVISCRNTGLLSLYQRRYSAAASSFQRIVEDDASTLWQRIEALAGAAVTHHALGRGDMAAHAMDDAAARLTAAGPKAHGGAAMLALFLRVVRIELAVQSAIRTNTALADHIFWHPDASYAADRRSDAELLTELRDASIDVSAHSLLTKRLQYLQTLLQACIGPPCLLATAHEHLSWLRGMHLAALERPSRIEGALVAIVASDAELARSLLQPLSGRNAEGPQRWNFELSYCRAKLCEMTGQNDECLRHYQRYALESVMCLRSETPKMPTPTAASARTGEACDEVELALPAKYRRAYRYLLSHMDRPELSVREIAEHIGVSERAVQSAFRSHLGMSPLELLRRVRVERIREDLLHAERRGQTVIETAARWGIRNRSTLVLSYRRHFQETPGVTLARRDPVSVSPT